MGYLLHLFSGVVYISPSVYYKVPYRGISYVGKTIVIELSYFLSTEYFMKKRTLLKKALIVCGSIFLLLIMVLAVHIYMVTRPKAPDAHTIVMARLDIHETVNNTDADKITA